ncbi:collagen binding domain-containing protein [Pseudomonas sp. NPDC088414]|uniref:MSCRAMM family protein n=1 Tax=Pseudomonas sp. NPDC088414 TaxID=3364454 RepID=UPI003818BA91
MVEPVIQANESLVLNGDFSEALSHWEKGPVNSRWVTVVGEPYEGTQIRMLSVGNLGSAFQEMTVPVTPGAGARYVLSFLYETRHTEAGRMIFTDESGITLKEIPLPPGSVRNLEEDQARITLGLPLEFRPIKYNAALDLPLQRQDRIRVTVVAPGNADPEDYHLKVLSTRIRLDVELEPARMQTVKVDAEQLSPGKLVYLCLGVDGSFQHQLAFVLDPDSPWLHTKAALVSDDNPRGAVTATPDWGVDQPLDSPWILQCPLIGDQDPYLFTVQLVNQYTAEPYSMQVSLGHHRLVFREVLEAAYFPVLELTQSVRLGVRVASWYTGQYLAGRTVTWASEGLGVLSTTPTDAEGWAYFDYLPTVAGKLAIQASVASLYYASGVETTTLDVLVLATDPWKDLLAVVENNALPWAQKTGYPNRGSTYLLSVRVPEVLRDTELAMHWEGDSAAQLGVQVRPELEEFVPVGTADLNWELVCRDELDGRFQLQLSCSKLLLRSDRKPMSLARNLVRIGDVQEANKFPVVDEGESVLLRVQVVHVVASGEGDPVNNARVDWETPEGTIATRSGIGGWASVLYQPSRAGELVVNARVRAHDEAVPMERPFAVKALQSSPWKGKINILFDGNEVDLTELGLLCWRGDPHTLRIQPTPGSSLIGQMITLQWRGEPPGIGLTVSDIGKPLMLEPSGLEWRFSSQIASSTSSLFSLALSTPGLASPRELFGRLISTQLMDELTLMLDQVTATAASQTLFPCIGAIHTLRYLPKALSPLVGLQATLVWQGTPADDLEASIEPPLDQAQKISDGGVGWSLDFTSSKVSGAFSVGLFLSALDRSMSTNPMQLAHNKLRIEDWRESAIDAVIGKDKAWSWIRVVSAFTGQAVAQVAVQWKYAGSSDTVVSDALGWSGFALVPSSPGEQNVVANVFSPFDGYEEQRALSFTALGRDPWEDVRVLFDGHDEHPWGSHTYFPRRNGSHVIEVLLPKGSPLFEQELTLGLTGTGPAELGLSFEPALGASRPSASGLSYSLRCADLKDGGFALRLGAERLASLSPANAMSLGEGAQVWKLLTHSSVQQVVEWEQELVEQVTVVSSISGQGIAGVLVTWRNEDLGAVSSLTDFYGVATVRFKPQTPGAAVVTASIGGAVRSESVDLPYTLEEPRVIIELYEPEDSRLPPNEERAHAVAKVVSARTGLPLAGVQVRWDFAGTALTPSVTDEEGLARLTFTYPADSQGVLSAVVRGGLGGWDMAQLGYYGIVPVIESLTSPAQTILPGQRIIAEVTVVSHSSGKPVGGIKVVWAFPGRNLPDTKTGVDGKSRVDFEQWELGTFVLTATVGFQNSQSLEFFVSHDLELKDLTVASTAVQLSKPQSAQVQVLNRTTGRPAENIEVTWSLTANQSVVVTTDASGWSRHSVLPTEYPDTGIARLSASVRSGRDGVTAGVDVWVSDYVNRMINEVGLLADDLLITMPFHTISPLVQGSEVSIQGVFPVDMIGRQCSVGCTHPGIIFTPAINVLRRVDQRIVLWKMKVDVPVQTQFAMSLYSPGIVGSHGARFRVIARSANEDAEDK